MPDAWARSATWFQAWTKGGRAILRGSLLLMALAGSFSCNADRCPSHLATIVERGGATYASSSDTATIENVASECIPHAEPAIETPAIKRGPRTQYEIASTATVRYATHEIFSGLAPGSAAYARVVFEAVTRGRALYSARVPSVSMSCLERVKWRCQMRSRSWRQKRSRASVSCACACERMTRRQLHKVPARIHASSSGPCVRPRSTCG